MAIRLGIGFSDDIDVETAADDAVAKALASLNDVPRGALVYASNEYDAQVLLRRVTLRLGDIPRIGCTASGLISGPGHHADDGVLVTLIGGDVRCSAHLARGVGTASAERAGTAMKEALTALPDTRLVVMHPDHRGFDCARGAQLTAPHVLVVGGNAGEFTGRGTTAEFFGEEVIEGGMALLAIAGDFRVSVGRGCGWKPMGRRFRVTRTEGRRVLEVNDKPVLEVLREFHGAQGVDPLADTPFAVFEPGQSDFVLRGVEYVDAQTGSMVFLSEVPVGSELQVTLATADEVLLGATESAQDATLHFEGVAHTAMMFSCTARKWMLGSRVADESLHHGRALGQPVRMVGFYAHGEIGPLRAGGPAIVHNQSCITVLFGD